MPSTPKQHWLTEADEKVMSEFIASGGRHSKAIGEVMLRLIKFLDEEGYATVEAMGVPPAFQGKYYTHAQAMAALPEPRRVIAANFNMVSMSLGEGFVQSCFDQSENLDLWIEAAGAIAPAELAARIVPFLRQVKEVIAYLGEHETLTGPQAPRFEAPSNLEREVTDGGANWWLWNAQYIMQQKASFFIHHADGGSKH